MDSSKLDWPEHRPAVVLDTDTYNEIDDQFALAYVLLARDRLDVKGIHAAPFHNERSSGPEDGMVKSIDEINRVMDSAGCAGKIPVCRGSTRWVTDNEKPESSEATEQLIELARASDDLLYVITIGAPTNVANAMLLCKELREKVVVLWLGGHPYYWYQTAEFNMKQDITASRMMVDPGTNLVRFPCAHVAANLTITLPEMYSHVKGRGSLGDYLYSIYAEYERQDLTKPWKSKVLWDIAPVAWLIDHNLVETSLMPSPILTDNLTWSHDPRRHLVREALRAGRDPIFADFFGRLPTT